MRTNAVELIVIYWVLNLVTSIFLVALKLPIPQGAAVLLPMIAMLILAFILMPIPFIGVAILYRKQFGDPEPAAPPVIAEST